MCIRDRFDVYRQLPSRIHPSTGELIEGEKVLKGKISVTSVGKDVSSGEIISSGGDIKVGDFLELSAFQRGDLEVENEPGGIQPEQKSGKLTQKQEKEPSDLDILSEKIVRGVVTKVEKNDVYFLWDNGYQYKPGKKLGIYRLEKIVHPISKKEIGDKLILIARINLVKSTKYGGKGRVITRNAEIKWKDLVGVLTEEKPAQRMPVVTAKKEKIQPPQKKIKKKEEAQSLVKEINQIRSEIKYLRSLSRKISNIEKSLAQQKKVTKNLEKTVDLILKAVAPELKEGKPLTLVPSKASMEVYQAPGSKENTMRIKYTDDINVKFQVANKTLLVSLDVDTPRIKEVLKTQQPAEVQAPSEKSPTEQKISTTQPEKKTLLVKAPFYRNKLILIGIAAGLLVIAGVLFFLIKIKKGKAPSIPEEEEEEEEEEISEEEEKMAEDEEEVFDEELE